MNNLKAFSKVAYYASRRFLAEKRLLWAASLTYTTIFSLIPLLSVLFFVFNIFGNLTDIKSMVQPFIYKALAPWAQEKVITILNDLVNNINFGTIGIFSSSVLIISVFLLLFEIEYALNEIWLIKRGPSLVSRAAIYWALLTIGPVLIALSLFILVTMQTYIPVQVIEPYLSYHGVSLLSYVLIWIAFTFIYFLMPGTPVSLPSALFGGIIAGTLWKVAGLGFSIYTSRFFFYYPKIFGSLAAIPLFLFWIFLCWILFLFGAELAYMHQNRFFYADSYKMPALNRTVREYLSMVIFLYIARQFDVKGTPIGLKTIAMEQKIPFHIVHELLEPLLHKGFLLEARVPKNSYMPGKPYDKILLGDLRTALSNHEAAPDAAYRLPQNPLHDAATMILQQPDTASSQRSLRDILPGLA